MRSGKAFDKAIDRELLIWMARDSDFDAVREHPRLVAMMAKAHAQFAAAVSGIGGPQVSVEGGLTSPANAGPTRPA